MGALRGIHWNKEIPNYSVFITYEGEINYDVTTVSLSVCYGALNLLVRVDTSNIGPYACDRAVM